jgi:hypothetical protein
MDSLIRKKILLHMYKRRCWNEKHTAFENAYSGVPGHLKGIGKQETELMIKENLLLAKQTLYGLQVSLNSDKIREIEDCLAGLI